MTKIYIDDVDVLTSHGIFLLKDGETGLWTPPAAKNQFKHDWDDEHGIELVQTDKLIKERRIKLDLGVRATSQSAFQSSINDFYQYFIDVGLRQLRLSNYNRVWMVEADGGKPFNRLTHWNSSLMVGLVSMNLIEPEPINRQFQISGTSTTVTVSGSGDFVYRIYWGDGESDVVSVATGGVGHSYSSSGKIAVVCGRIEKATSISATNSSELTW